MVMAAVLAGIGAALSFCIAFLFSDQDTLFSAVWMLGWMTAFVFGLRYADKHATVTKEDLV